MTEHPPAPGETGTLKNPNFLNPNYRAVARK
jgi:hypothetical protein